MGEHVKLTAQDGHELDAYVARPRDAAKGALVVVQEIFGVNAHIRSVVDRFAEQGYVAIAPALFDRIKSGVELKYEGLDAAEAMGLMLLLSHDKALLDVAAAYRQVQASAVVGFCYGGLMSWLAATRGPGVGMSPKCTVCYYPGGIGKVAEETPSCPVIVHVGLEDSHVGPDQLDKVRAAHPAIPVYTYPGAEHGFNCDARSAYHPQAAALAWERTLAFLAEHVQ